MRFVMRLIVKSVILFGLKKSEQEDIFMCFFCDTNSFLSQNKTKKLLVMLNKRKIPKSSAENAEEMQWNCAKQGNTDEIISVR